MWDELHLNILTKNLFVFEYSDEYPWVVDLGLLPG